MTIFSIGDRVRFTTPKDNFLEPDEGSLGTVIDTLHQNLQDPYVTIQWDKDSPRGGKHINNNGISATYNHWLTLAYIEMPYDPNQMPDFEDDL